MSLEERDLVAVGAGPANLSLAALTAAARERGHASLSSAFLERNTWVRWHSGQMFPGTLMQTEFYRDLVTPIDPTSRFTFLNYLKSQGRIDQFFCSLDHLSAATRVRRLFQLGCRPASRHLVFDQRQAG